MQLSAHEYAEAAKPSNCRLIYVDLDGTLIHSDLLWESFAAAVRRAPWKLLAVPWWLMKSRAHLKARLAALGRPDIETLPMNMPLVDYLRARAQEGAVLVLATAASQTLALEFAKRLPIFARTLSSSESRNLKGREKAAAILEDAGGEAFAYVGNDNSDLAVWKHAAEAIVVSSSDSVRRHASDLSKVVQVFSPPQPTIKTYVKALRIHQWLKNALVFVPMVAAHVWTQTSAVMASIAAFLAFSFCASGVYLVNDMFDLASDRAHPRKRLRPLAAGTVPIPHAVILAPLLAVAGLVLAWATNPILFGVTVLYMICTSAYSFGLKSFVLADAIVLGGLYTLRILAGAAATGVVPSFWLLAFSMAMFLSLALIKRCSELGTLASLQRDAADGRDYRVADYMVLQSIGVASGCCSVLIFALFINSEHIAEMYSRPQVLWVMCGVILYWISRMWIKTARGEMHDDPIVYAVRDRTSLTILALSGLILAAAL